MSALGNVVIQSNMVSQTKTGRMHTKEMRGEKPISQTHTSHPLHTLYIGPALLRGDLEIHSNKSSPTQAPSYIKLNKLW
jgi:hypothetical protein